METGSGGDREAGTAVSTTNDANGTNEGGKRGPITDGESSGKIQGMGSVVFPIREIRAIRSEGCSVLFPLLSVFSVKSVVALGLWFGAKNRQIFFVDHFAAEA